jgi:DNA-binding NtrC family response regulator
MTTGSMTKASTTKASTTTASKLTILYSEGDAEVLAAQSASMRAAGHTVHPAAGRKAVEQALGNGNFDLVVLGPTLTRNDRHHLPYMVKKANSKTSVLVLHADGTRHPSVDACTDTGATIETVLARIESMNIGSTNSESVKSAAKSPEAAAAVAGR